MLNKGGYDVRGVAKVKSRDEPDKVDCVREGVEPFTVDALPTANQSDLSDKRKGIYYALTESLRLSKSLSPPLQPLRNRLGAKSPTRGSSC